jgi:hypothetical protein
MEVLKLRSLKDNNVGSAVPVILFIVTIVGCGGLYTLFFLEFGLGFFDDLIPASDVKTFLYMCFYAMPLMLLVVGSICLVRAGLKREVY